MYSFYNVAMHTLPVTWHWVLFEYIVARSTRAKYRVLILWFSCRPQTRILTISSLTSRFQNPRRDLTGSQKSQLWWKGTKIVQLSNSSMRPHTSLRQCYRHLSEHIRLPGNAWTPHMRSRGFRLKKKNLNLNSQIWAGLNHYSLRRGWIRTQICGPSQTLERTLVFRPRLDN